MQARHCQHCGACILNIDHHCPWSGKCIADNNMQQFNYFLKYVLQSTLCLATSFILGGMLHRCDLPVGDGGNKIPSNRLTIGILTEGE